MKGLDDFDPRLDLALNRKLAELKEEMLEEHVLPLLCIGEDPRNGRLCFFPSVAITTDALTDIFNRGLETVRDIAEDRSEP